MTQQHAKKHYSHQNGGATGEAISEGFPGMGVPMGAHMGSQSATPGYGPEGQ